MNYKITASIVMYKNDIEMLRRCVKSFLNTKMNVYLFLIDNSPKDDLKCLADDFRIQYLHNPANLGFGAGHNIVLNTPSKLGKYHIVLNPDIYFESGVLETLKKYMDENPDVGNVMPNIVYPDGDIQHLCKMFATPFDLLFRRFIPFKKIVEKRNHKYEFRFSDYNTEMEVPSLSGCFMFVRSSIFKEVGGFDERYFMYLEDLDLCRRIGEVSRTIFYPIVKVTHAYEKGSYKNKKLLWFHISSAVKYFNKWGWFWDKKRVEINKKALLQFK